MAEFDRFADEYEHVLDQSLSMAGEGSRYFARYKADVVRRSLGGARRILDFGCGVGLLLESLREALPEAELHGFDVSAESLARAGERLDGRARLFASLRELEGGYDLIVVANVLHHVPLPQRPSVVRQAAGLLAPGGALMVFEHNPWNPVTRRVVCSCPFDRDAVLLPAAETLGLLASAGLVKLDRRYIVFFPRPLGWLRWLEPFLGWLPLGAQYVAKGDRP